MSTAQPVNFPGTHRPKPKRNFTRHQQVVQEYLQMVNS